MEYRVDDLELNGLKLKQDPNGFCFGIDAVYLANYSKCEEGEIVVDLCTGNGIIPVLLTAKIPAKKIYGVEIQKEVAELALENVRFNNLEEKIEIINEDLNNIVDLFGKAKIDVITCNPPYRTRGCGMVNEADTKAIARHEIKCTLEEVIKVSATLLRPLGKFYMIHRPDRICDILTLMREYKIEPKRIKFIQPSIDKNPEFVLIEGLRGGKKHVTVEKTMFVE
jgi:tRNA1Val (adenine37-N6)-methyltransferase